MQQTMLRAMLERGIAPSAGPTSSSDPQGSVHAAPQVMLRASAKAASQPSKKERAQRQEEEEEEEKEKEKEKKKKDEARKEPASKKPRTKSPVEKKERAKRSPEEPKLKIFYNTDKHAQITFDDRELVHVVAHHEACERFFILWDVHRERPSKAEKKTFKAHSFVGLDDDGQPEDIIDERGVTPSDVCLLSTQSWQELYQHWHEFARWIRKFFAFKIGGVCLHVSKDTSQLIEEDRDYLMNG